MNKKIIDIKEIDFSYDKKKNLLQDLSLTLDSGRIHGLLGKNGEGKSTLLKLISGLCFPKTGSIDVMGFEPAKRRPEMLEDIFFLSEELPVISISIRDFEKIYAPFYPAFSSERFEAYLKEFEIDSKDPLMTSLSHGQKKKVFIAFALATNVKLLLFDEPTNGLDIPSKAQFRRMVASVISDDNCLIVSTHQVRDLDGLIDSIIVMDKHKIVFNETAESIGEKLLFKVADRNKETDSAVIYSEDTLHGIYQLCENRMGEESKIDIELLFNAITVEKQGVLKLFSKTS